MRKEKTGEKRGIQGKTGKSEIDLASDVDMGNISGDTGSTADIVEAE